jgi:hypothetical protein
MKKKEIIALVAVIVAAVVMISIGSYAYFTAQVTGTSQANTITSGTMAITYADGPSITLDNAIPGDTVVKTFTVTNTGNVDSNYDVYLSEVNNGFADQTDLAYSLTSTDGGYSTTSDIQVPSAATKIVSAQAITASATHHYTLTIKFLAKDEAQDDNQGKTFSAKIQVNEYKEYGTNLATGLLTAAGGTTAIAAKTAPTYTNSATTDEGMFATTDDYGTSYYYRGAVTTNNVVFGGYCWKTIRINGNGTTRMIYNGIANDTYASTNLTQAEYLNVANDATYAYTYDTGTNQWTSSNTAKTTTSTITFKVGTAGDYAFNYTLYQVNTYDRTKVTIYVDDVSKGEFSTVKTSSVLLTGLTTSSVIKVTYTVNYNSTAGDKVSFSLGKNPTIAGKACNNIGDETQIGESKFNSNDGDNAYVGYMYGATGATTYEATHANTNSSTAKTAIDTWYNTNLASYASKISDTAFCNDRSIASTSAIWDPYDTAKGYGTNETHYGGYNRFYNTEVPILTCQNKNDRFTVSDTATGNGALTYPVGLITMDEAGLAGASMTSSTSNSSYYLYTHSTNWTMSSVYYGGDVIEFSVSSDGSINLEPVNVANGLRPVINLKTDTLYTSGDGTVNNPYLIS